MPPKIRTRSSSKHVTVEAIALRLGISAMTVSRALNGRPNVSKETKERVLAAAKKYGYVPNHIARSLATKKTDTIGVVVPEITHSFFPEVIRGIEDAAYAAGYHLILAHSAEDYNRELDAMNTLKSKRVDGMLISIAQTVTDHSAYGETIGRGIPIVFFDRVARDIGASSVSIDDENCCTMITEHLIDHGYKSIAHLSGPTTVSIGKERLAGFRKALKHHDLRFRPELVVQSGFHENGGYAAMEKILQLPPAERPDAVVAVNDPAAFGAMKAMMEHGLRIPEDIAIVGMSDDVRAELASTPLTTMRQPAYEIGKTAAATLISEIEGKSKPGKRITVDTELIVRKSCGCGIN
ncbi:MAG TPA: LacI family DNA-binding transcriptional regulator [Candidatus Acidoferrales bacterium]|nr:LacI family DNA-binding transcriptional regulator [Candidatus Acidoferrales bacterium]